MKYTVRAYLITNEVYEFPARDLNNARETAARITREGAWVILGKGVECYWPTDKVFKVKIFPAKSPPPSSMDLKK